MLEIAPEDARGSNSAFTGGAFCVVYHGSEDLARLIPDMNETELRDIDFGTYTARGRSADVFSRTSASGIRPES
jgi:tricarballylate dehydrogenase